MSWNLLGKLQDTSCSDWRLIWLPAPGLYPGSPWLAAGASGEQSACREHTKWNIRAQGHSQEYLSQSSSTFNPISPPKRSTIHSMMSVLRTHFVLHPLAGKGLGMVAAWSCVASTPPSTSLRQSLSGLSGNQETSCPSRGRKSGEYQKSLACTFVRPLSCSLPLLICVIRDQQDELLANQVHPHKSLWSCPRNYRNIWMLFQLGLCKGHMT